MHAPLRNASLQGEAGSQATAGSQDVHFEAFPRADYMGSIIHKFPPEQWLEPANMPWNQWDYFTGIPVDDLPT